jgi:hypothetical protein
MGTKEELNKWRHFLFFNRKPQFIKLSILPKLPYNFGTLLIKLPTEII